MACPRCGAENPDDALRCSACGCILKQAGKVKSDVGARTSKLAILSLLLGVLSLLFFVLAGVPAIVIAVLSVVRIAGSRGSLKGTFIALAGMIVSVLMMSVFAVLWCFDAPPIPDDYTLADLRSAPAQCAESFEILKTLIDEDWSLPGAPAIGLTKGDIKVIDDVSEAIENGSASQIPESLDRHAAEIDQAWARAEKARNAIRRLNEFPEVADLTEPRLDAKTLRWHNLIALARLYQVHAHLQTESDGISAVIADLVELDSVFRKLSPNVRGFMEKLICLKCIEENIVTANAIVNNPAAGRKSVELLARHFTPLTNEQMSLRNGILSEYLVLRDIVSKVSSEPAVPATRLFKGNSMLRLYRNFYGEWINRIEGQRNGVRKRLRVWPAFYPFPDPSLSFNDRNPMPLLYRCYNPLAIRVGFNYRRRMIEIAPATGVTGILDDLFQIVLNKRLGKEVSLKARAYSDEYIVDVENKKIFSPGPDGKANTRDDIKLSINPDVLGW
jgi:zinc-ribbon domain